MFQDTLNALKLSLESTHQVQSVTNEIVDAVLSQTKNILSMISILLAIIIRVEAHEYDIQNMIATAKKYFQQYVTLTVTGNLTKPPKRKNISFVYKTYK
jgi:hypothetical protein